MATTADDDLFARYEPISARLSLPRGRIWEIGPRPAIMGILNVTPDSFSDGGDFLETGAAVERGLAMIDHGADVIDVGGESTRPGAHDVADSEQKNRIEPVIRGLRRYSDIPISVDTRSADVGRAAITAGADIINDVSALSHPDWIPFLSERPDIPVVIMHMRGSPRTMQTETDYGDVVAEVRDDLAARVDALEELGIARDRIIVDPGIGFAKEARHNLGLLRRLRVLTSIGCPVLLGASRKLFLGRLLASGTDPEGMRDPRDRDIGTVAANAFALLAGAAILRVHNVPFTRDLIDVFEGLMRFGGHSEWTT